jgi:hypothetical protein
MHAAVQKVNAGGSSWPEANTITTGAQISETAIHLDNWARASRTIAASSKL